MLFRETLRICWLRKLCPKHSPVRPNTIPSHCDQPWAVALIWLSDFYMFQIIWSEVKIWDTAPRYSTNVTSSNIASDILNHIYDTPIFVFGNDHVMKIAGLHKLVEILNTEIDIFLNGCHLVIMPHHLCLSQCVYRNCNKGDYVL